MVKKSSRIASVLLSLALVFSLMSVSAFAAETSQNDIINYTISSLDDLRAFEYVVETRDAGNASAVSYGTYNVELTTDIVIPANTGWDGIGIPQSFIGFAGTFNGNGHTITVVLDNEDTVGPKGGLFNLTSSYVVNNETVPTEIKNLTVVGTVDSNRFIGGIVGRAMGSLTLTNCYTYNDTLNKTLALTLDGGASNSVAGLIGQCGSGAGGGNGSNSGGTTGGTEGTITIDNCSVKGSFTSETNGNPAGGMIGHVYAGYEVTIKGSTVVSGTTLTAPANTPVGAYVANNAGTVTVKNTCANNTSYPVYGTNTGTFTVEQ